MRSIEVPDSIHARVALLARAWRITEGEVIDKLLDEFMQPDEPAMPPEASDTSIPIHTVYDGYRIEASYNTETKRVDVLTGPLAGQSFKSPSGAAIAVVKTLKPNVHPNRNGWTFWTVTESGELLQTVRST